MVHCAVQSCKNKSGKNLAEGVTFHFFPRDPIVKQVWIDFTGRGSDWKPERNQICSEHFEEKCFNKLKKTRRLFLWAFPTVKPTKTPPVVKEKPAPAASKQGEAEEAPDADGETLEINNQIKKRKRLDDIFVKPLCSGCKKRAALNVSSTMLEGQAKSIVAKVYHFLNEEYRDIKDKYGDSLDLTPLTKFRERTAFACGVSYRAVGMVLKEEQEWLDARGLPVEEPPKKKKKGTKVQPEEVQSSIDTSEEEITGEVNAVAEQNSTEGEAGVGEIQERESSEEARNIDSMDFNDNYANNDILGSVSVEFEYHDIDSTMNQSLEQNCVEPTIVTMINQSGIVGDMQSSIPEMENQSQMCIDPNMIAIIDSGNQSSDQDTVCGIKPRIIGVVDPLNHSKIEDHAPLCAMEPAVITMINHQNLVPEMETPQFSGVTSRLDLEPTIIAVNVVSGEMPTEIKDTCPHECCQEKATLTFISPPTDYIEDQAPLDSGEGNSNNSMGSQPSPSASMVNEIENENNVEQPCVEGNFNDAMAGQVGSCLPVENQMENPNLQRQVEQSGMNSAMDLVDSACQTDRDTDTPLLVAAGAQVYCGVDGAMNAVGMAPPAVAHLEAQAIVAEPQYFAGNADAENMMNVQRVDYADGLGYYVILN